MTFKDGRKSGGRQKGTTNKATTARYDQMVKVNAELNELGEDSLSGMKLLQTVINSRDCPLDVRITCSGLLLKHELPLQSEQRYVAEMPAPVPQGESGMATWWALYGNVPMGEDPEWDAAVRTIIERIPSKKPPGAIQ
jgi:hypothetical protein